jgi:hypothetical protein
VTWASIPQGAKGQVLIHNNTSGSNNRSCESSWVPWRLLIFERGWSYGELRPAGPAADASPLHPA